ncbi:CU044_5270 family protein [Amycolatopsis mediterranei]|uniref:CU044_5270 family protein n=1 Tax=Amycolatopsis mediterranei TaxID=33910 RepID=UPI003417F8B0
MNDLQTLRAALVPGDPAQDVVDRSRHRLQNRMLGAPRKRFRPFALGAGLVAAATAAAVVVATLPGTPAPAPPQAVAPAVTGVAVLLAAADVAEHTPAGAGKYWHVTTKVDKDTWEYWTAADGQEWYRVARTGGKAVQEKRPRTYRLPGAELTVKQILALPTEPTALRNWLADKEAHSGDRTSKGPYTADQRELAVLEALISLVSTVPAPPAVRAAAFRAIAVYPGVSALGDVPDGQGVQLPGGGRLVVDPATGKVDGKSMFLDVDGKPVHSVDGGDFAVTAEWTDDLPK